MKKERWKQRNYSLIILNLMAHFQKESGFHFHSRKNTFSQQPIILFAKQCSSPIILE